MTRFHSISWLCCFFVASVVGAVDVLRAADKDANSLPPAAKKKIDFVRDIRPILVKSCIECHGAKKQESGLRLDQKAAALTGGDSGAVIALGKSEKSLLIKYVAGLDPEIVMPPEGDLLPKPQVALLRAWIDQGANWPDGADIKVIAGKHWSFQPVKRHPLPKTKNAEWILNPIDAFVLARLEAEGIQPSPQADRYTLLRRLNLDLLGLPPTVAQVDEFINDKSPQAYEKLVDRLLRSPHFGERWGRHWLDKARYADSDGYEKDRARPNAWRWRDWVIDAINRDMPFDQFTIEQQAGDLLPKATAMQKLATAFHRQTLTNTEGGTDKEQFRVEACFDRVETTGIVWLGLTIGCARCHSHKYDQITQREYYQIFAFANNGDEANMDVAISEQAVAKYKVDKQQHDNEVADLAAKLTVAKSKLGPAFKKWEAKTRTELQARSKDAIKFHALQDARVKSDAGVTLNRQKDGSFLASGKNPPKDNYTIVAKTNVRGMTGFRIETLPDKSLPAKGPGRVAHGNFVLNEFQVWVAKTGDFKDQQKVDFATAKSDFSQKGWPVAKAIDGDAATGWAIAPKYGQQHNAVFTTKQQVDLGQAAYVKVVLNQQHGQQHTIGRFRLTVMTGTQPALQLPDNVLKLLALSADKLDKKQQQVLLDYYAGIDPATSPLIKQLDELKKKAPKAPTMSVRVVAQRTSNARQTRLLRRGDFLQPLDSVQPNTLSVLHPLKPRKKDGPPDRLDLARWLVSPENPLTPRVAANHIWAHLFGRGLVRTLNDFGVRGERPTDPKLLDWLASEYLRLGWSRKAMIKQIVMSATYRQSSSHRAELFDVDPENRLLYRQNRFRVEAEIIRDTSLAVGGLFSPKLGGPSVFPPMPADVAELSYANNFKWNTSKDADRYRRGMYTFFKRTAPHPNLTAFDCPDSNTTCVDRTTSNTPLQALTTLNNAVFVESSQAMAKRVLTAKFTDDADRMTYAFRLCVARPPSDIERTKLLELLNAGRAWFKEHADDAKKLAGASAPKNVAIDEAASWVTVARIIMNMDEFITRE